MAAAFPRRDARRRRLFAALTLSLVALAGSLVLAAYALVPELRVQLLHLPALLYSVVLQTLVWWNVVVQLVQLRALALELLHHSQRVRHKSPEFGQHYVTS